MTLRGRYAPSPTGSLHLGNARTALVAYLSVRNRGGAFVMRVEDLDSQRSKPEFVRANLDELRWLGLEWDEGPDVGGPHAPYLQSERFGLYQEALETLQARGHLFACHLSRKDLRELASAPHGRQPVYGAAERAANDRVAEAKRRAGKVPSLRFRTPPRTLRFEDLLAGPQALDAQSEVGDFVVRRADGEWAYQLAVVVDDIAMGISEVVRGDDLLAATGAQLLLYEALGEAPPRYAHVPLLLDEGGERLAKRKGSLTLSALCQAGVRPERVVGLLAHSLGLLGELQEASPSELLDAFTFEKVAKTPVRLESRHLAWLAR
jgi:glutamyl-tRNA synthetase